MGGYRILPRCPTADVPFPPHVGRQSTSLARLEAGVDTLGCEMIRFVKKRGIACHTRVAWLVMASIVNLRRSEHKDET